jgi:hypothetical protein
MLEPNDVLFYLVQTEEQEPQSQQDMEEYLREFFDDDYYDIYAK